MFKNLYQTNYILSNANEPIEFLAYSAITFFVPLLIGHPQWIVGTLVNASLILAGLNFS